MSLAISKSIALTFQGRTVPKKRFRLEGTRDTSSTVPFCSIAEASKSDDLGSRRSRCALLDNASNWDLIVNVS